MSPTVDPRNAAIKHYVDGTFVSRTEAALPLFDSGFLHGKQVWSAPRLVNGRLFRLQDHLDKIRHSAQLNLWPLIPDDKQIIDAVRETLLRNSMRDGVHVRIMLTAGTQITASMDIASVCDEFGQPSSPRIIIAPEYRDAVYHSQFGPGGGIAAMTSTLLRPGPDMVDQRSHDNNQNASSRACSEAKSAGVTTSLMYDGEGFLAEAFASHAAIVKNNRLLTPFVRACPDGVTRKVVLELCATLGIAAEEANLTREQVRDADELMILGTMSGPVPVLSLDGAPVGEGSAGALTQQLTKSYVAELNNPAQGFDIFESPG